ncbi:MAG: dockerin type I domain-containing protein, partial [Nitrospira sp.]
VAYLGSFNSGNIALNYLGDPGGSPLPFQTFSVDVPANATVILVVSEVNLQGACGSYDVVVTGLNCPLKLTSAVSRKTHGAAGEFDIPVPPVEPAGVEPRTSGGNHNLVFTLESENPVTGGSAALTLGTGNVGTPTFLGTTMTVPLSGVTDLQKITLTLSGVTSSGRMLPATAVSMNVLAGDTNGNRSVNATDIGQTKSNSGLPVGASNFRTDVNANGSINASDISQVKANSGHNLP